MPMRCERCHRELKDAESIENGMGPVCALKAPRVEVENTIPFMRKLSSRSNYTYRVTPEPNPVLVIYDLNRGGMSVTNNIEAILADIRGDIGDQITTIPIIYKDSEGYFDGVDATFKTPDVLPSIAFFSIGTMQEHLACFAANARK